MKNIEGLRRQLANGKIAGAGLFKAEELDIDPPFKRALYILALYQIGYKQCRIAAMVGVSKQVVGQEIERAKRRLETRRRWLTLLEEFKPTAQAVASTRAVVKYPTGGSEPLILKEP